MAHTQIHVDVYHSDLQDERVGTITISLMEFVRGLPAKMRWLSLESTDSSGVDRFEGELLVRTLFLADGIRFLPHPSIPNVFCTTAEGLLSSNPKHQRNVIVEQSFDPLGFSVSCPPINPLRHRRHDSGQRTFEYFRLLYECLDTQQVRKWDRFHRLTHAKSDQLASFEELPQLIRSTCTGLDDCAYQNRTNEDLRRLIWGGIPSSCRPDIYMHMSGATKRQHDAPKGHYQSMLQQALEWMESNSPPTETQRAFMTSQRQIQVDLQRTFAGNNCWTQSLCGQTSLERVLLAYATHNQSLGYCQSMTFITAKLLCLFHHHRESRETDEMLEERVFWLLVSFCESYFPSYYSQGMLGIRADGLVLEELLKSRLPKLSRHFKKLQTQHTGMLLATSWMLPLFCAIFPSETTYRLLDVVIWEGSKAMIALVIALLRVSQQELLNDTTDYLQLFNVLKERDAMLYDTALLMEVAYEEFQTLENEVDVEALRMQAHSDLENNATLSST